MVTQLDLNDLSNPDVRAYLLDQRRKARAKKTYDTPPSIPEIATAYKNDPRTQLAMKALATGSSTAPVAQGGYGIADGIARALTGVAGGYINKRQEQKYGPLQEDTLDRTDIQASALKQAQDADAAQQQASNERAAALSAGIQPPPQLGTQPPAGTVQPPPTGGGPPPGPGPGSIQPPPTLAAAPQIAGALMQPPSPGPSRPTPPPIYPAGAPPIPAAVGGTPGGNRPFGPGSVGNTFGGGGGDNTLVGSDTTLAGGPISLASGRDALLADGAKITSGYRTPAHNAEVGGVKNSFHTRGTPDNPLAYDFVPSKGESMADLALKARKVYPGFDVINEGNHVHVEPSRAMAGGGSTPAAAAPVDPLGTPPPEPVPDAPATMARPGRPLPVAARRSELLQAAYNIMRDRDPFQYEQGQEMLKSGLSEQDKMNEAAAAREQSLLESDYGTDLGLYKDSVNRTAQGQMSEREAAIAANRDDAGATLKWQRERADQREKEAAALKLEGVRLAGAAAQGLTAEQQDALNEAFAKGVLNPYKVNSRNQKTLANAYIADPNMDANKLNALYTLQSNVGAQTRAANLEALPDTLNNVRMSGKALKYNKIAFLGRIQKIAKGELNDPDLVAHMNQRNDAMMTVANVMRGAGATNTATALESEVAKPTMDPGAWEAWFTGQLIASRAKIAPLEARGSVAPGTTAKIDDFIRSSDYKPKWYTPPSSATPAPKPGGSKDPNRSTW